MKNELLTNQVLAFLSVKRSNEPDLAYLNEIIKNYQLKVKWETLTKVIDWENGNETGQFLPPIETYFDRIINKGMGGTCWTHAVGLHWLLSELEFYVDYIYMDSGHICLRIELDQPYYVDVGYCAPLFQAYPLFGSFIIKSEREIFEYTVVGESIKVTRTPGPTKTLNPNPVTLEQLQPIIKRSNDWETSFALREIQIFAYLDGVPSSLKGNVLKQHFSTHKVERTLTEKDIDYWVTEQFGVDREMYEKALEIYKVKMRG